MTKENKTEQVEEPKIHTGVYDFSRKILLAAVGAAVVAQDEIDSFVNRLVERGEIAEKDARNLVHEVIDKREKMIKEREAEKNKRQASVASKSEVDALTKRIDELKKQIEELKKG